MRAVVMEHTGGPGVLRLQPIDRPEPGPGEVLLRVHATSVNHADLFLRSGRFELRKHLPHVLGGELAGTVEETGDGVEGWQGGDRVMACFADLGRARDGTYAEYTCVPATELHRLPETVGFVSAATIGWAFSTAWIALIRNGHIGETQWFGGRERMVVSAASSGVGTAAVQIARWKGATVVAISSGKKASRLLRLGAHRIVSRSAEDLADRVLYAFGGRRATLILDLVGRDTLTNSVEMLERHGRIVCVGTLSGDRAEIDALALIRKNATIQGSLGKITREEMAKILDLFANGTFYPVIDSIMPLSAASAAHKRIEAKQAFGKVVLVPDAIYPSSDGEQ